MNSWVSWKKTCKTNAFISGTQLFLRPSLPWPGVPGIFQESSTGMSGSLGIPPPLFRSTIPYYSLIHEGFKMFKHDDDDDDDDDDDVCKHLLQVMSQDFLWIWNAIGEAQIQIHMAATRVHGRGSFLSNVEGGLRRRWCNLLIPICGISNAAWSC